jgi:hypothetical protein
MESITKKSLPKHYIRLSEGRSEMSMALTAMAKRGVRSKREFNVSLNINGFDIIPTEEKYQQEKQYRRRKEVRTKSLPSNTAQSFLICLWKLERHKLGVEKGSIAVYMLLRCY